MRFKNTTNSTHGKCNRHKETGTRANREQRLGAKKTQQTQPAGQHSKRNSRDSRQHCCSAAENKVTMVVAERLSKLAPHVRSITKPKTSEKPPADGQESVSLMRPTKIDSIVKYPSAAKNAISSGGRSALLSAARPRWGGRTSVQVALRVPELLISPCVSFCTIDPITALYNVAKP